MRARAGLLVVAATLLVAAAVTVPDAIESGASSLPPDPTVGALFFPSAGGSGPALGLPHTCTAGVVHSSTHDLVLTAAHCLLTPGSAFQFAPGYAKGALPYGLWTVTKVFVNAAWNRSHDPQHDYAFLRVAPRLVDGVRRNIEDVTGAHPLGIAPAAGTSVTVTGYAVGSNDEAIRCRADTYVHDGFPAVDCAKIIDGMSGGPWVAADGALVGLVGGLQQGGCSPTTGYSPAFGRDIMIDLQRAQTQVRSDSVSPLLVGDC